MLLNEAQAKMKWCPNARTYVNVDILVSANRHGNGPDPECLCLASTCMAWRWVKGATEEKPDQGYVSVAVGYCGAFGKPSGVA